MEAEEAEAQTQPALSKFWQHSSSSSDDDSVSSSSDSDSESDSDNSENKNKSNDQRGADGHPRSGFWGGSSDSSDSSDSDSDSDAEPQRGKGRSAFLKNANDSSSDDSSSDDSSDDSDDDDDDDSRSKKPKWQMKKKLQKQRQAKFRQRQQQNLTAAAGKVESLDSASDSKYTRYICDGCDSGIHTVRWHSTAVADFDLCQSCYGSSTLTTSHGPFQSFAVDASHYEVQTFIGGNVMPSPWPPAVFERGGLGSWRLWLRHQVRCQAASAPAPAAISAACCV